MSTNRKNATQKTRKSTARPTASPKAKAPKSPAKTTKKPGAAKSKNMSGLDAAAVILGDAKQPLNCKAITEAAMSKGLWSPKGRTPIATLSSAIQREMKTKGRESRFIKTGRGLFTLAK